MIIIISMTGLIIRKHQILDADEPKYQINIILLFL